MARFEGTNLAPAPNPTVGGAAQPAITLLYARPTTEGSLDAVGARLARIVARYRAQGGTNVDLQQVAADALPSPYAHTAHCSPTLVVLRDGEVVGEAIGTLPSRELERLVRRAVEWPQHNS